MIAWSDFSNDLSDEQRIAAVMAGDPRLSEAEAHDYLDVLHDRFDKKQELLERGMSNKLAEKFLDRQGWPRPQGWSSVFYYPGSTQLRTRYLVLLLAAFLAAGWSIFA